MNKTCYNGLFRLNKSYEFNVPHGRYKRISNQGAKAILSNSDPKNEDINDNFFDDLYKDYNIERIKAKRSINSNGKKRGLINEILVTNY